MSTWYKTSASTYGKPAIQAVESTKDTEHFVTVGGRRQAKISDYDCYFLTWGQAWEFLATKATREINVCKSRLESAQNRLEEIKQLANPDPK